MPISDKKKCQTLINICAQAARQIKAASATLLACRAAYQTAGIDPTGTPLDGNVAAVSTWIDSVETVADVAVADAMIAAEVPTHQNQALEF